MTKSFKIITIILVLFFSSIPLLHADEPMKDPFYTQGQEIQNPPPIYGIQENVDPFSGNLKLVHTDVHLPGNGGLDLTIMRTYDSAIWGRRDYPVILVAERARSPLGIGWSLHMGIVRNPTAAGLDGVYMSNHPVVEMPDGSQHILYRDLNYTNRFVSKDYWIYEQVDLSGVWALTLTDGTVYTFQYNPSGVGYSMMDGTAVAQVTKIQNPAKNAVITIGYERRQAADGSIYSYLKTITDSTARVVTFNYDATKHQLNSISMDGTLISYSYQSITGSYGTFNFLKQARLPEGTPWNYSYYSSNFELQTITFPQGGTITYEFSDVQFNTAPGKYVPFSVVTKRTAEGRSVPAGIWTYGYDTGGSEGNKTTITAPGGVTEVHTYFAWGCTPNGAVYTVGLPGEKHVFVEGLGEIYAESHLWSYSAEPISHESFTSPSWTGGGYVADPGVYVPRLLTKWVLRDSKLYTTNYSNYDAYGNPGTISESGDAGRTTNTTYWYNSGGNIVANKPETVTVTGDESLPGTFTTTYTRNSAGFITQVNKQGLITVYSYSGQGNLDSITDANSHITFYDWTNGRVSRKMTPLYTISREINSAGTIKSETNGRGYTTSYTYDGNFRLLTVSPPTGNPTSFTYPTDNSYRVELRGGYSTYQYFDGFGRPSGTSDSKGVTTEVVYTAYGPKDHASSNIGDTTYYDLFERVEKIVHQDASNITYSYSGSSVTATDEASGMTYLTYHAFGSPDDKLLVSVTDALNNNTTYNYNILGSLTQINQGAVTRTFTYDSKNFLAAELHPDRGAITYSRDNIGNILTKTDGMGTTNYTYDDLNRLIQISADSETMSYTYDEADNKITSYNASANIDYTYDETNRLTKKNETMGGRSFATQYAYDANDNLADIYYPSTRHAQYSYNLNNQVTSVTGFGGSISNIDYYTSADATPSIGLPHRYTYSNGHTTTLTYNSRNLTAGIMAGSSAVNMAYGYDVRGNTSSITDNLDGTKNQILTYDNLNRLLTFAGAWGAGSFSYDALGNRQSKAGGGNYTAYGYTNNRLTSASSGGAATTYTYNNDGDLTDVNGRTLVYNQLHNLKSYEDSGTPLARYTYDGEGMRVTKTPARGKAVVYHYDQGGRVLSESDESGNFVTDYIYLHGKLAAKVVNDAFVIPPAPARPSNLTAQTVSSSQINLTWTDNANNEDGFVIERKIAGAGTYTQVATLPPNTTSYSDTGLTESTTYSYRVWAYNAGGPSAFSTEATARTLSIAWPNPPSGLAAAAAAYNQVALTWTDNANNESGFVIERKHDASGTYAQIATVGENVTSYLDTTVIQSSTYLYRVKATNSVGDSTYSNETSVTTPVKPQGGIINTIAGNGLFQASSGDGDPAVAVGLGTVNGVALDLAGNIYIAAGARVRKVDTNGISITVAGNGLANLPFGGDGVLATSQVVNPYGIAVDNAGNIYIADAIYSRVRKVDTSGIIITVAGNGILGFSGDGGLATQASLNGPSAVAVDNAGNIYIADYTNQRIRKVDTSGIITTLAGNGLRSFSGDGGPATEASLKDPNGVAADNAGNIYIADIHNRRIRKVDPSGVITTFAGKGSAGDCSVGGPATQAYINSPVNVASDNVGNIYIADTGCQRIRLVDTSGTITSIAGNGSDGFSGDGVPATQTSLYSPTGVAIDISGNIYIADGFNMRVRKVTALDPVVSTTALPGGNIGTPYIQTLKATGGKIPYTWSIIDGTLPAGLNLNGSTGTISGTPLSTGNSTFTVKLADADFTMSTKALAITIYDPLIVSTSALSVGMVSVPYSQTLAATGGLQSYTWSIVGALPAGLTLDSTTGVISGTPTAAGTFNFTVQVMDANSVTNTKALSITIWPQLIITTSSLPSGKLGTAYSQTLAATGGKIPYAWSVAPGTLPTGLILNNSTGVISGTPTVAGTFNFTVQVLDANSFVSTKLLSITIADALVITTPSLPSGTVGTPYNQTLSAIGGTKPYAWSISTGKLPTGLTLNATTGVISGTPTTAGTYSFTVKVTDAKGITATKALSIIIYSPLSISTSTLSYGTVSTAYSQTLAATGGKTSYAWSISAGSLPSGLTLNSSTGVISGTPTAAGTFNFTVQVTDANATTATKALSIIIYNPLSITTTSLPNGKLSTAYSQTLGATGGKTPYTWSIASGSLPRGLSLNTSTGVISGTPTRAGTSIFTAQVKDANATIATKALTIIVQ